MVYQKPYSVNNTMSVISEIRARNRLDVSRVIKLNGVIVRPATMSIIEQLQGAKSNYSSEMIVAYVTKQNEGAVKFAPVVVNPLATNSHVWLGNVDPSTRELSLYGTDQQDFAMYREANNLVVEELLILPEQIQKMQTLDSLLNIRGIRAEREIVPDNSKPNWALG